MTLKINKYLYSKIGTLCQVTRWLGKPGLGCSTDGGHHITMQTAPCILIFSTFTISIWHAYRYHLQFKGISLTYHPNEHFVRTKAVFLKRVSLPLPQERIFLFKGKAQENNHSWVIFHKFMAHTISSKPKWFCQKKKKKKPLRAGCRQQWWVRVCGGGTCVGGCLCGVYKRERGGEKRVSSMILLSATLSSLGEISAPNCGLLLCICTYLWLLYINSFFECQIKELVLN